MDVDSQKMQTNKLGAWLSAARLRTLPLALASTLTGGFVALHDGHFDILILVLTALTTIALQVNSNFANDYGDFQHGTDNEERIGPERALQSGALEPKQIRNAIVLFSILSLVLGVLLLLVAPLELWLKAVLFVCGVAAIYASIKYTAGNKPYGYRGLGDLSVMAFFGVLGVVGAYVCQTGELDWTLLLPSLAIGAFSTGVLNVNNTRDIESDKNSGKITLAVRMGAEKARNYHVMLMAIGVLALLAFGFLRFEWGWSWLFLAALPLFALNAFKVKTIKDAAKLDPYLKQLALSTFLLAILLGLGLLL